MNLSIMRALVAVLLLCGTALSQTKFTNGPQVPEIPAASLPTASTVPGKLFAVTDAASSGVCTGGGSTWVLCVSNGTTWQVSGGGFGTDANNQSCPIPFSATLSIDTSTTSGGERCGTFTIPLTGNVTSFAFTSGSLTRANFTTKLTQDATGSRIISGVAGNITGMCPVAPDVNKDTWIEWEYNGTNYQQKFCVTNGTPTTIGVANGGTGDITLTNHGTLVGAGTSPVNAVAPGMAGFVLTSNGASLDPTYQAPATAGASGLCWVVGGPAYTNNAGVVVAGATGATAFRGLIYSPNAPCVNASSTHFHYTTQVAASSGSNGLVAAYFNTALTSILCETVVATAGQITNAGTAESLTWASGANVSGGICTTTGPYLVVLTSNDTTLTIATIYDVVASQASLDQPGGTATGNIYAAYSAATISSGAGATITLNSNLSANTWTAFGLTNNVIPPLSQR